MSADKFRKVAQSLPASHQFTLLIQIWEMACFSGFLVGREAAKRMVARGSGTIIFTGLFRSSDLLP